MAALFSRRSGSPTASANLFRFFSITSLVSVVVTATLLAALCRQLVIPGIIQHFQTAAETIAATLRDSLRPELDDYLESLAVVSTDERVGRAPSPELVARFREVLRDTSVVRIKLYDRDGVVVFSTDFKQIGETRAYDAGFLTADKGGVVSNFIRRDTADSFEKETERDNLVETYIAVRTNPLGPVLGVLEIYTDMNRVVSRANQIVFILLAAAVLILLCHFGVLMLAVRRVKHTVETEKRAGNARAAGLETLAVELLNREDAEKKKIASDLHEELAQTLSAIKFNLEHSREHIAGGKDNGKALDVTVPAVQDALQLVQGLAVRLWPLSLDELGLLSTISGFCDDFQRLHPEIRIDQDVSLNEQDVPQPLKIVIYRIIELVLGSFVRYADAENVTLSLRLMEKTIELQIDAVATLTSYASAVSKTSDPGLSARFATVQERATLSGGTFVAARDNGGGITLLATWKV